MRPLLERLGAASPLVLALTYAGSTWLLGLSVTIFPAAWLFHALVLLAWAAAGLLLLVVVVWYRDDDWLAAGFLLSLTLLLSAWTGDILAEVVVERSVAPAILKAPGMFLGVALRALVGIPALGGVVAFLRWVTRRLRPAPPTRSEVPSA